MTLEGDCGMMMAGKNGDDIQNRSDEGVDDEGVKADKIVMAAYVDLDNRTYLIPETHCNWTPQKSYQNEALWPFASAVILLDWNPPVYYQP